MSGPLLATLLAAEHAAVYGYGLLGARLDEADRRTALAAFDSHRARRDQLTSLLRAAGEAPQGPLPAYDVTASSAQQALALAVRVEDGLAVRWRDLMGGTDDRALRMLALAGLQETAVRAAQWRMRARITPATVPFPGTA